MAEGDAVKVCLRIRPIIQREQGEQVPLQWKVENSTVSQVDGTKSFNFDRVFDSHETTAQVYQEVAVPIIRSVLQGYNGTIFAYGQTSSGKTYTMMGTPDNLGIIPRAVREVFQIIQEIPDREFLLRVSYMEIYNETVTDLLCDDGKKKPLEIREDINRNVYVASLTEELVMTPEHVLKWIKKGEKNRHYGETKMNDHSSRSHTIFRMIVESREQNEPGNSENCDGAVMVSHLNLVDLAGSERASQTGAEGVRFKEGCNINRSLFILGQVIKKLSDGQAGGFINYRDSKLTRILQNSLGGNTKTVIICTITSVSFDETLSTLQFASTAKHVRNTPHVNEVLDDQALLKRYRKEIMDLKKQLEDLEASSEMKAHAMAKEERSQLLGEIKQLQKEREDRIWNLTNIVVASSQVSHEDQRVNRKRRVTWAPGKIHKSLCVAGVSSFEIESKISTSFAKRSKYSTCTTLQECDDSNRTDNDFEDATHLFDDTALDIDFNFGSKVTQRDKAACRSMIDFNSDAPIHNSAEIQDSNIQKLRSMEQKVSDLENKLKTLTKEYEEEVRKRELLEAETAALKQQVECRDENAGKIKTLELQLITLKDELQNRPVANQQSHKTDCLGTPEKQKHLETSDGQVVDITSNDSACSTHLDNDCNPVEESHLNYNHDLCREQIQMLEQKIVDMEGNAPQNDFMESLQICEDLMKEKEAAIEELSIVQNNFDSAILEIESLKMEIANLEKYIAEKKETNEFELLEKEMQKEHEAQLIHEIANLKALVENSEVSNQELLAELDCKSKLLKDKEKVIADLKKGAEDLQKKMSYLELSASLGEGEKLCEEVFQLRHSLSDAETVTRDAQREAAFLRSENLELKERMEELSVRCNQREKDAALCEKQLEMEKLSYKRMQADLQKELQCSFNEINKLSSLLEGRVPKDLLSRVELEKEIADYSKRLANSLEEREILEKEVACLSNYKSLPSEVENLKDQVKKTSEELVFLTNEKKQSDCIINDQKDKLQEQSIQIEKLTEEVMHMQAKCHQTEQQYSELKLLHEALQEQCLLTAEEMALKNREAESLLTEMDEIKHSLSTTLQEKEELVRAKQELAIRIKEIKEMHKSILNERDNLQDQLNNLSSLAATLQQQANEQSDLQKMKQELEEKNSVLITEMEQLHEQLDSLKSSHDILQINNTEASCKLETLQDEMKLVVQHRDELYDKVEALKAEKDCLKQDLSENIELSIETQDELRITQEELKQQKQLVADLRKQVTECAGGVSLQAEIQEKTVQEERSTLIIQLEENEAKYEAIRNEKMELEKNHQSLISEKEVLQQLLQSAELALAEVEGEHNELKQKHCCLVEKMTCVSRELDELKNLSNNLHGEKDFKDDMDTNAEQVSEVHELVLHPVQPLSNTPMLQEDVVTLKEQLKAITEESGKLHETLRNITSERDQLKLDLQENIEMSIDTQEELRKALDELKNKTLLLDEMSSQVNGKNLEQKILLLEEQLSVMMMQRDQVIAELKTVTEQKQILENSYSDAKESLPVLALHDELQQKTTEHQHLLQKVEELEQINNCMRSEMESLKDKLKTQTTLESSHNAKLEVEKQFLDLQQKLEAVIQEKNDLTDAQDKLLAELGALKENLTQNNELIVSLQEQLLQKTTEQQELFAKKEELEQGQNNLRCEVESLTKNMLEAQSTVQSLQNEGLDLQQNIEVLAEENEVQTTEEIRTVEMNAEENNEMKKTTENQQQPLTNEELMQTQTLETVIDLPLNNFDKTELVTLRNEKMKTEEKLVGLQQLMATVNQEREELQAILQCVRSERDQLKEDLRENVEMSIETQDDLRRTQDELQQQRHKAEQLASVISSLDKKCSTLERELHDTTTLLKEATSEQEVLNQSKQKMASELDQILNDLKCKENALEKSENEKSEVAKKLCELNAELKAMAAERDQIQSSKESLEKESIETHGELRRNQEQLKEQEQRIEKLTNEVSILGEKSSSLERELHEKITLLTKAVGEQEVLVQSKQKLATEIEHLMEVVKSKDFELGQVAVEKEEASRTIIDLSKELSSVSQEKDELQLCIENLQKEVEKLRGEIQHLQDARDLLAEHQSQNTGQFDDLATEIKQLQQKINLSDSTIQQLENDKAALQKQVQQYELEMGSLLQEQEQRIEKLTNEFSLLEEKSFSLERELKEKIILLTEAVGEREGLVQSKQKMAAEIEQLMEAVKGKDSELGQIAAEKEEASCKILELSKELRSILQEKNDLQLSKENLQEEADKLREEKQQLQHQHELLTEHQNQKNSKLDDLVAEIKQLQEKINLSNASSEQLETDKASLQKQVHQFELDMASLRQEQEQFQQLLQRARSEKENIYANLQAQEKDAAQLRDALNTTQTRLDTILRERDESNERLVEKVSEVNDLLQKISSLQQELHELHQKMKDEKRENRDLCERVDLLEKEITALRSIQSEPVEEEDELAERTEIFKNKNQEFKCLMENISTVCSNHHSFLNNICSELQSEIEAQKQSMSAIKESLSSACSREFGNLQTENYKLNIQLQTLLNKFKVLYNNTSIKEEHYSLINDYERDLCAVQKRNDELAYRLEQHDTKRSEDVSEDLKFCELEFLTQLLFKKVDVLKRVEDGFSKVQVVVNNTEDDLKEESKCKKQFLLWLDELRGVQYEAKKLIEGLQQENSRITGVVNRLAKYLKTVAHARMKADTIAYLNKLGTDLQERKEKNKELLQKMQQLAPSGDSSILQEENARLHDHLKTLQVELKRLQCRIKDLENELNSAKADAKRKEENSSRLEEKLRSNTAESELLEMRLKMAEKEKHLQTALKEINVLQETVAKGSAPYKDEMDSLRSQLVNVEMNRMKLSKAADQQITSLKACLEDKEECLRKLKEQLRRAQKDADSTFCGDGEGASSSQFPLTCGGGSGIVQSTAMLILQSENAALKKEISHYKKKCHQLSRNITIHEDELKKIKEQSETSPSTPTSLNPSQSNAEVYKQPAISPIRSGIPSHRITSPGKTGMHRKNVRSPRKTVVYEPRTMSPNKTERHSVPIMSPGKTGPYRKLAASPTKTDVPLFSALTESPRKNLHVPEVDSSRDKFFDMRSKSMPYYPTKFFDNSMLGTLPGQSTTASVNNPCFEADVDMYAKAASETNEINWWDRPEKKEDANECKTS